MYEVNSLAGQFQNSANEFWVIVSAYMPQVFGALLLLIIAVIVAKLAQTIIVKALQFLRVDRFIKSKSVSKSLKTAEIDVDFVAITGRVAFWVVIVVFALTIADVLGLSAMRDVIRELLAYLPSVLAAAIILTITVAGARLVRDVVDASLKRMRVDYSHVIANISFYALVIFGAITALNQLGFNTTILTTNITVIVAGIMLALALAFGLGGRAIAARILEDVYAHAKKPKSHK